jgi:metallo-beta-lactamase class B
MKVRIVLGLVISILAMTGFALAQGASKESSAIQQHVAKAMELAGSRYHDAVARLCSPPDARPRPTFTTLNVEPAKLFDNLYFIGLANVYAWAVDTPEGIILLDSLNNAKDAEVTIVGGLKKLGLDPARIKYVIISHAHGDHFGGAPYIKQHYNARILASEQSWQEMEKIKSENAPAPKRDMVVTDGQKLAVGGITLTFVQTPGHTPGTTSVIVPVLDRGQRHMAFILSGPRTETLETTTQMLGSEEKLAKYGKENKVDVQLTNHSYVDNSLPVIEAVRNRKPGEPNAYVIGEEGFQKFVGWQAECLKADIARSGK